MSTHWRMGRPPNTPRLGAGLAKRQGATLIIVTLGETPYDDVADVRIHGKVGEVLPPIAQLVLAP